MSVELVKSVSDSLYKYRYPLELEDPFSSCERGDLKKETIELFNIASIKDYKLIENNWGYDALFRLPHDLFHFQVALQRDARYPVEVNFLPPPKDRVHIHGAHRLKKKFKNAAKLAGAENDVHVVLFAQDKRVVVAAPNLAVYFDFWEKVPYSQRIKLGLE